MCFTLPTTFPKTNSFIHYRCHWIYDRNYNIIPFWAEKVPLSYTFNWKMVPLPHTQFITLHASLFTAVNALSFLTIWINQGAYGKKNPERFLDFFLFAFLGLFNDRKWQISLSPSYLVPQDSRIVLEYFFREKSASSKLICII